MRTVAWARVMREGSHLDLEGFSMFLAEIKDPGSPGADPWKFRAGGRYQSDARGWVDRPRQWRALGVNVQLFFVFLVIRVRAGPTGCLTSRRRHV